MTFRPYNRESDHKDIYRIWREVGWVEEDKLPPASTRFFNMALIEKIAMVGLISIIFAQILPDVQATNLEVAVGVAFVIILNSVVSHWFARRGRERTSAIVQFIVMAVVNFGLVLLYDFILPASEGDINLGNTLFFVLLLTLLVTMFDRYYPVYRERFAAVESA